MKSTNPTFLPGYSISGVLLIFLGSAGVAAFGQNQSWPDYGAGPDNSHFVKSTQITKANVGKLEVAWSYPYGQTGFNPIIVDNRMYVIGRGALIALDATTGKEVWIHEGLQGINSRGINYWESKDRKDRRLIFSANSYLQEVDATTGKSILSFGREGAVNLREGLGRPVESVGRVQANSPGKIFENLVILGSAPGEGYVSPPGDVRAYDVIAGKLQWQFHTVPHPGELGYDTNPKDAWKYLGGDNTWADMSVDAKRGIVYFPLGSPTYDFYGADRTGNNLFGDCILALDARTGKYLWHFQMIHHDLWDWDEAAAPQLFTATANGRKVDMVAQFGKDGYAYVFDRVTGKPIWPIPETKVPQSDVPGEHSSPTQPIPSAPPPFVSHSFTVDDINPYLSAEEQAYIKNQILTSRNDGMFTPPSLKGSIQMPANIGGANWGSTAADPDKGLAFVFGANGPAILKLEKSGPGLPAANAMLGLPAGRGGGGGGRAAGNPAMAGRALYATNCESCHGAELMGGAGPALTGVTTKMGQDALKAVISGGKGFMPAFSSKMTDAEMDSVIAFLANPNPQQAFGGGRGGFGRGQESGPLTWLGGTVVQTGPAPGAQGQTAGGRGGGGFGGGGGTGGSAAYPPDVEVPSERYNSGYGISPNAVKPPWSTLTAYDMNTGTIKWQVPVGDDLNLAAKGIHNTGTPGLRNTGIVPTATGLVFEVGGDNKIRAYDEDNGKVVWEHQIAGGSSGCPSIYEINGREYLVITVSGPGTGGRGGRGGAAAADPELAKLPSGYVVFALPQAQAK